MAVEPGPVLRVRDLVDVAPVRPVVRLADLADASLRADLARAFVLTDDASHVLATVFGDIRAGRGRGYVLEGHYGAGKSHLLAVVHGLASGGCSADDLGAALGPAGGGRGARRPPVQALGGRPLAVAVSLLEHAAREPLEAIVLRRVADALCDPALYTEHQGSRREWLDAAAARARASGHRGILLCLDELGEFLQAKPEPRAFAEDVRFLQLLGEWAASGPAWVLLGVQEALDQASDLPAAVGGGLRDRFALRFRLGAGHIAELVSGRLIRYRPGAEAAIARLGQDLVRAFGAVPGGPDAFARLYPVHPLTVDLLDRLRPLFSQRRGVVDFVASRLAGDPGRRIPPWLDRPAGRLLGPEAIVDHFRDRIRERPETAPLVDLALDHCERDLARLFPDREMAAVARRLTKVLIAGALCPTPLSFSAEELTLALLHRFTDLDPALNREFVSGIADRLVSSGAYVASADDAAAGRPPVRRYRCDVRADLNPVLRSRIGSLRRGLSPEDGRLWAALLPACNDPSLPVAALAGTRATPWAITWRRSPRQVVCRLVAPADLTGEEVRAWVRELEASPEADALLLLLWGPPREAQAAAAAWLSSGREATAAVHADAPVLVWAPRAPGPAEADTLRHLAAQAILASQLEGDLTDTGRRLREHLQAEGAERQRRTVDLVRDLYLQGQVFDSGGGQLRPADLGPQAFGSLLARLTEAPLARRYPDHPHWPAPAALVTEQALMTALGRLLHGADPGPPGSPEEAAAAGLLGPLGLCRKDARGWRLTDGSERGPHAAALCGVVQGGTSDQPVPVGAAYLRLRKGSGGLGRGAFHALCLTLVRTGEVCVVRRRRRLAPEQVTPERIWAADGLCPGALVEPGLRPVLRDLPMVPQEIRARPLSHGSQRAIWQAVCAWRRDWDAGLADLRAAAARARRTPGAAVLVSPERLDAVDRVVQLLPSIPLSLARRRRPGAVLPGPGCRPRGAGRCPGGRRVPAPPGRASGRPGRHGGVSRRARVCTGDP